LQGFRRLRRLAALHARLTERHPVIGELAVELRGARVGVFGTLPLASLAGDRAEQTAGGHLGVRCLTRARRQFGSFGSAPGALSQLGEHDRRTGRARIQLDGRFEGLGGLVVTPRAAQHEAQVVPGLGQPGVDRQRLAIGLFGLTVATRLLLAGADVVPRLGVIGLAAVLDGRQFATGGGALAAQYQRLCQFAAQSVGVGRQADGDAIALGSFIALAGSGGEICPALPDRRLSGRKAQRGGVGARRLVRARQPTQRVTEETPVVAAGRLQAGRPACLCFCRGVIAEGQIRACQIATRQGVPGCGGGAAHQPLTRRRQATEIALGQAGRGERVRRSRVNLLPALGVCQQAAPVGAQPQFFGHGQPVRLGRDRQRHDRRVAVALEAGDRVGRNRDADVLPEFEDAAGDPEQPAGAVEQAAAARPGRHRGAGDDARLGTAPVDRRNDAGAHRQTEAKRIADCKDRLALADVSQGTPSHSCHRQFPHLQQAQIAYRVFTQPRRHQLAAVGKRQPKRMRLGDDMAVGHHPTCVDDDAAALAVDLGAGIECGNGDHLRAHARQEVLCLVGVRAGRRQQQPGEADEAADRSHRADS